MSPASKRGKKENLGYNRPIVWTSILRNIFEQILKQHVCEQLEGHVIIKGAMLICHYSQTNFISAVIHLLVNGGRQRNNEREH